MDKFPGNAVQCEMFSGDHRPVTLEHGRPADNDFARLINGDSALACFRYGNLPLIPACFSSQINPGHEGLIENLCRRVEAIGRNSIGPLTNQVENLV